MANVKSINGNPIVVGTAGIEDGAVTLAKLGSDVELTPPDGSVTTAKLADGAVTDAKLAQSGGILDKLNNYINVEITPDKTSFFNGVENLFNPEDPNNTTTGYYNRQNTFVTDNSIRSTGFIPVIPGNKYTTPIFGTTAQFVLWFTQANDAGFKTYQNYTQSDTYCTVPDDVFFAKFTYNKNSLGSFGVYKSDVLPTYSRYSPQIEAEYLQSIFPVRAEQLDIIKQSVNLFNPNDSDVVRGGYYDRTNTYQTSNSLGMTGYISIEPSNPYAFSPHTGGFVLWFDSNKEFLTYSDYLISTVYVTSVLNAKYARFLFVLSEESSFIVNAGTSVAQYEPYATPIIKPEYLQDATYWYGLTGVAFGTSLTYRAQTTGGYLQYLPTLCGAAIDNKGVGSSTILNNGTQPNMLATIKAYTAYAAIDFAILEGFVNDWYYNGASLGTWKDTGETTVCGCVRSALTYMLTQNPSLTVMLIIDTVGKSASGVDCSSLAERNGMTQKEFYDEVAKVAKSIGIPVIRVDELGGMSEKTPYMYIDNIHPTAEGAKQTANTIWSVMKNIPIKVVDA